jgi:DNA-binding response OmpR family regulator
MQASSSEAGTCASHRHPGPSARPRPQASRGGGLAALDPVGRAGVLGLWQVPHLPAMRILVIEDERQLAGHITRALSRHGHCLSASHDGAEGLQVVLRDPPDLVVLDLNLPTLDGFSVLAKLRQAQCPSRVLILTARGEVEQRVKGLHAGADDYLTKPFSMDELAARVEALGRRGATATPADLLKVADLHMDVRHRRVTRSGKAIALSPREFDVLQVLMQEPGRPFSRTELCERVWQRDHEYDTRTVEIFITRLRKKIDSAFPPPLIHTLRGVGYTLRAPE